MKLFIFNSELVKVIKIVIYFYLQMDDATIITTTGSGGIDDEILNSPKRGPTLSTSTSSFEALDPHDPNLSKLASKMFYKTGDYITHELNASLEDYKLLENMNRAAISKYSDMKQIADNLETTSIDLKDKFDELVSNIIIIIIKVILSLYSKHYVVGKQKN